MDVRSLQHLQAVEELFEEYAETYEEHLIVELDYRVPEVILRLVEHVAETNGDFGLRCFGVVVDTGCGTGLCGAAVRALAQRLVGIDVSGAMVDVARIKGEDGKPGGPGCLYDKLVVRDVAAGLRGLEAGSVDLIIAGGLFVYVWSVSMVLAACAQALRPGGALVFTTERLEEGETQEGWTQRPSSERFAHTRSFITRACTAACLQVELCLDEGVYRDSVSTGGLHKAGDYIPGDAYVARRLPAQDLGMEAAAQVKNDHVKCYPLAGNAVSPDIVTTQ